jgi:hypothetical protein
MEKKLKNVNFTPLVERPRSQREKLIRARERAKAEEEEKRLLEPPKEEKERNTLIPISKPHSAHDENIYYNIRLINNTNKISIPASYKRALDDPLLRNPSEYELAVTRFSLPGTKIPIMVWDTFLTPLSKDVFPFFREGDPWDPVQVYIDNAIQASDLGFSVGSTLPIVNDKIAYDTVTGIMSFTPGFIGVLPSLDLGFPVGNKIRFSNNFGGLFNSLSAGDYTILAVNDVAKFIEIGPGLGASFGPTDMTNSIFSIPPQLPGAINPNYNPSSKVKKFYVIMTAPYIAPADNIGPCRELKQDNYQSTKPSYAYDFTNQQPLETTINSLGEKVQRVYRTVNAVEEFVYMLNYAILEAFIELKNNVPAITSNARPFMRWNAGSQLCELLAPKSEFTSPQEFGGIDYPLSTYVERPTDATPKQILYFNQPLYNLFQSLKFVNTFPYILPPDTSANGWLNPANQNSTIGNIVYRVDFYDKGNNVENINGVDYVVMTQDSPTTPLWNDISEIVFETDTLPVNPELQTGNELDNTSTKVRRTLVTDFLSPETLNTKDQINYTGLGWKRYTDLNSSYPLRDISVTARWKDTWGTTYPINIGWQESFSMKLLFRKKTQNRDKIKYYEEPEGTED